MRIDEVKRNVPTNRTIVFLKEQYMLHVVVSDILLD